MIKNNKTMMIRNIFKFVCGAAILLGFTACKNGDRSFDDFEGGTTVYFPYQYPVRTIVLGDDEYDTSLDQAHKCQIKATFGGSYNGSNGSVQVAVDNSLVNNLTFADGTPVKAMPDNYYTLSTTSLNFGGTMNGTTEVQLSDAFFADPDAVKNTYVIPLVIVGQNGFDHVLTGTLAEGKTAVRTDASAWDVLPMDFVLYCVKFQNKYTGFWLTNKSTSTDNIENANVVQIKSHSLNSCIYTVTYQRDYGFINEKGEEATESRLLSCDLLLNFDGADKCTISSLTPGVTATGNGSWADNSEKKAWGNKDRDGMELSYTVDFGNDDLGKAIEKGVTHEKLVWQRSGVAIEEFAPVYAN